jgi:DNA polymerase-1
MPARRSVRSDRQLSLPGTEDEPAPLRADPAAKPAPETPQRLFLLDGTALAYRGHHALGARPLTNSRGENTSAAFVFLSTILALLRRERPDLLAVVFDPSGPTFRHRQFAEYKATRQKMPDELAAMIPVLKETAVALGLRVLEVEGFEADDVIGTLARQADAEGLETMVVTADKDFMQCVTPRVRLYNLRRGVEEPEIIGPAEVETKLGVRPEQVPDVLGLMGDTSDNIPGVPGVGPKRAAALVRQYGSLEETLRRVEEERLPSVREQLRAHAEQARLSRRLATIATDVPLPEPPRELRVERRDTARLRELFERLEFSSLLDQVEEDARPETTYRVVRTAGELDALVGRLSASGGFVFDLETTGIDPLRSEPVGIAFCTATGEADYVPFNLPERLLPEESSDLAGTLERLRPLFEDVSLPKAGQNVKFDILAVRRMGVRVAGVVFDTMLASYLIDPSLRRHNLESIGFRYLGLKKSSIDALIGTGAQQRTMREVPVEDCARYSCEDADLAFRLWRHLAPRLRDEGLEPLLRDVELPLLPVLVDMEARGVAVDRERLLEQSRRLGERIAALEAELQREAGEPVNVSSPVQLRPILFEKLRVQDAAGNRRLKRVKTGLSTDQSVLEELRAHPFVDKLLEHRSLTKLKNTYLDTLPALVHPDTGRIHTSFNQTVAATGRLSSSDPNLQNIPVRSELGREIRRAFVPGAPGWRFLSADYSQIELRVMAHLSGDPALQDAFRRGADIHRDTAARVFHVQPGLVSDELRGRAKAINFGILYGMGAQRLARETGMTEAEAARFIDAYFASYPRVKAFLDETLARARETGVVTTLLGRRRPVPELRSENGRIRAQAENVAVNTPIQGSAADLMKVAMVRLHRRLHEEGLQAQLLLQVHDELLLETPGDELERAARVVREEMEGEIRLDVPLRVDLFQGPNWCDLEELDAPRA